MLTLEFENPATRREKKIGELAAKYEKLEDAAAFLIVNLKHHFIYKGGYHVAVHRKSQHPRIFTIRETR